MAKNSIPEYDSTPANNTDVGGISITGSAAPRNFDDSQRQIMAHLRDEHDAVYALLGKNRLINGGFDVNQLAVSGTVVLAAGDYGHDMWKAGSSGCTYTFATVNNVTTITISAGTLQNIVEGKSIDSGTHCLSWSGTAQGRIDGGSYGDTGITGTATGGTNLTVEFGTGTLSNVSLIEGSIEGNYKRRQPEHELALCQWHYRIIGDGVTESPATFLRVHTGSNTYRGGFVYPKMRDNPSVTVTYSNMHKPNVAFDTVSSVTVNNNANGHFNLDITPATDHTAATGGSLTVFKAVLNARL